MEGSSSWSLEAKTIDRSADDFTPAERHRCAYRIARGTRFGQVCRFGALDSRCPTSCDIFVQMEQKI